MVSMKDIRAFARRIATEFGPTRIILFGSYAYGRPTEDSDVDLMVVMPYRGHSVRKAAEIRLRIDAPLPLDLLVRSAAEMRWRYRQEEWFIREIVDKGRVLYEAADRPVGRKSGDRVSVHQPRVLRTQDQVWAT
jgi:predicted nucleotidyltransferase